MQWGMHCRASHGWQRPRPIALSRLRQEVFPMRTPPGRPLRHANRTSYGVQKMRHGDDTRKAMSQNRLRSLC
jgi:hypothetical protein